MYIRINVLVYGKCWVVNIRSMTKKGFMLKMLYFLKIMSQTILFLSIQAPNMSKHISRNKEAIIKASRLLEKQLMIKKKIFQAKRPFLPKNGEPSKKCYSPKSVYWYQCFNV